MRKILVAEDDIDSLIFISRGLREAGFSVEEAPNALAAYEILFNTEVDLIILDLMLPDIDGFEFLILDIKEKIRLSRVLILNGKRHRED